MERLRGNEAFLRAMKNGGDVFTYIPDWLRDRLHARSKRCGPKPYARWVTFNRVKDDEAPHFVRQCPNRGVEIQSQVFHAHACCSASSAERDTSPCPLARR
jgi:hypothetical protein